MYSSKYESESRDETNFFKKNLIWLVVFILLLGGVGWFFSKSSKVLDNAFIRYEEYQEIYNTCQKINTDLGTILAVDEKDRMFESFSKASMIANKKQQMSRWVEEYNAKSRMWNRALWKSKALPYELNVNQFSNFK